MDNVLQYQVWIFPRPSQHLLGEPLFSECLKMFIGTLGPTELLQVLWKAGLEPHLISNNIRGSRISWGCDDQELLDQSASSAEAVQALQVKKERFLPPSFRVVAGKWAETPFRWETILAFGASKVYQFTAAPLKSDEGLQDVDRNKISLTYIFILHALLFWIG